MNPKDIPAFPCLERGGGGLDLSHPGMTLRDHFAGLAMQGMLTTSGAPALNGLDGYEAITAKAAYKLADEMLKVRES